VVVEHSVFRNAVPFPSDEVGILHLIPGRATQTLVLFVHGYTGDHYVTWGNTPFLMLDDADFQGVDLCFLGYGASVSGCAALGMYLSTVLHRATRGHAPFQYGYERVVLVAHSLGGLGVRAALLHLSRSNPNLLTKIPVCLLVAPPLFGFHASRLRFKLAIETLSLITPVVLDLRVDEPELLELREGTDRALASINPRPTTSFRWALYDRIVVSPPATYVPPPPDTQEAWPYGHTNSVKPDTKVHPFYKNLREIVQSF